MHHACILRVPVPRPRLSSLFIKLTCLYIWVHGAQVRRGAPEDRRGCPVIKAPWAQQLQVLGRELTDEGSTALAI